jgi:hypothetical protein
MFGLNIEHPTSNPAPLRELPPSPQSYGGRSRRRGSQRRSEKKQEAAGVSPAHVSPYFDVRCWVLGVFLLLPVFWRAIGLDGRRLNAILVRAKKPSVLVGFWPPPRFNSVSLAHPLDLHLRRARCTCPFPMTTENALDEM